MESELFPFYNRSEFTPNLDITIDKGKLPLYMATSDDQKQQQVDIVLPMMAFNLTTMASNNSSLLEDEAPLDTLPENQQYQLQMLNYWINGIITTIPMVLKMV